MNNIVTINPAEVITMKGLMKLAQLLNESANDNQAKGAA